MREPEILASLGRGLDESARNARTMRMPGPLPAVLVDVSRYQDTSPRSQRRTAPMLWKLRQATPRTRQSLRIASELALTGLAGAAEQLEVVEAGEVAGELADVAAEDGRSTCSAP